MNCPVCDQKGIPCGNGTYKCTSCGGFFDDDPDEGSSITHSNPVVGAIKREEFEERERARKARRMAGK